MHFLCKVVFCSCLFFCGLANSETFLAQTTDIPLMPGVIISPVEQMDFDTPAGQVIVLEGISKQKTASEIVSFYENVLPQMGWETSKYGEFSRQDDAFNIVILKNEKPSKVRFDISFMSQ